MCCTGGQPQNPAKILADQMAKANQQQIVPKPIPKGVDPKYFSIPKEIKEQLIRQQQLARIPQKTG